jgi:hypothetical protein
MLIHIIKTHIKLSIYLTVKICLILLLLYLSKSISFIFLGGVSFFKFKKQSVILCLA